jgi:hypothetical protein
MPIIAGRIDNADVATSISAYGNILPDNGVGLAGSTAPVVVIVAGIINPWPPEPQIVTLTDIAWSDAELTEIAAAHTSLVEVARADVSHT